MVGETGVGDGVVLWRQFVSLFCFIFLFLGGFYGGLMGFVVEGLGVADEDDCGRHDDGDVAWLVVL